MSIIFNFTGFPLPISRFALLISSFAPAISLFCTVWDKWTCSQPIRMQKLLLVYYYTALTVSENSSSKPLTDALLKIVGRCSLLWHCRSKDVRKKLIGICKVSARLLFNIIFFLSPFRLKQEKLLVV